MSGGVGVSAAGACWIERVGRRQVSVVIQATSGIAAESGGMCFLASHVLITSVAKELGLGMREFPAGGPEATLISIGAVALLIIQGRRLVEQKTRLAKSEEQRELTRLSVRATIRAGHHEGPRGYFGLPRDIVLLDGKQPTDVQAGVPTDAVTTLRLLTAEVGTKRDRPVQSRADRCPGLAGFRR